MKACADRRAPFWGGDHMHKPTTVALALVLGLSAAPAWAWNSRGHMIVAAIAWEDMTPAAQARADALLKLNPRYGAWTASAKPQDRAKVAFMRAATWPDEIKNHPDYSNDSISAPEATQNIGYDDLLRHKYWHYKNLPFSTDGTPTRPSAEPNAETQIDRFVAALSATATTDDVKSYDLAWLLHLIGDVHQPLHATARFSATLPNGDSGGNAILVCPTVSAKCDASHNKPLHSFWDATLGTSDNDRSVAAKAAGMVKASQAKARIDDPTVWLEESLEIAKSATYASPVANGEGPYRLTTTYEVTAGSYAEQRAALAGARLAHVLNTALQ